MIEGKVFLNTRPVVQAASLTDALKKHGAKKVIELAFIDIQPLLFDDVEYTVFDHVIFVSQNAVLNFVSRANIPISQLKSVIAVGPATQQLLLENGVSHCLCPTDFSSLGVLALPNLQSITNEKILIVAGEQSKPTLKNTLCERGAMVVELACYRRVCHDYHPPTLLASLQKDGIDMIISTSMESLQCLLSQFESPQSRNWLCEKALCVVTNEMQKLAKQYGFSFIIQSDNSSMENIVETLNKLAW